MVDGRHADTAVAHLNLHRIGPRSAHRHHDFAAHRAVYGVVHQALEQALEQLGVGLHGEAPRAPPKVKPQRLRWV